MSSTMPPEWEDLEDPRIVGYPNQPTEPGESRTPRTDAAKRAYEEYERKCYDDGMAGGKTVFAHTPDGWETAEKFEREGIQKDKELADARAEVEKLKDAYVDRIEEIGMALCGDQCDTNPYERNTAEHRIHEIRKDLERSEQTAGGGEDIG